MSDVKIDGKTIVVLLSTIADIYQTYQAEKRIDGLKMEEAKELADKIWVQLREIHEETRKL